MLNVVVVVVVAAAAGVVVVVVIIVVVTTTTCCCNNPTPRVPESADFQTDIFCLQVRPKKWMNVSNYRHLTKWPRRKQIKTSRQIDET